METAKLELAKWKETEREPNIVRNCVVALEKTTASNLKHNLPAGNQTFGLQIENTLSEVRSTN